MTDEDKQEIKERQRRQAGEFPETKRILTRLREAMAEQMFKTKLGDTTVREAIFLRVQTLDAMLSEMDELLRLGADDKLIEEYIKKIATTES